MALHCHSPQAGPAKYSKLTADEENGGQPTAGGHANVAVHVQQPAGWLVDSLVAGTSRFMYCTVVPGTHAQHHGIVGCKCNGCHRQTQWLATGTELVPVSWTHKRGAQLDAISNDSESGSNDSDSDGGTHATGSRQHSKIVAKAQGSMPRAASQEGLLTYAVDAATAEDGSSGSGQDSSAKQSAREQHQANGHQSSSAAKASDRGQLLQTQQQQQQQPKQQQRPADEDVQRFVLWQPPPELDSDAASAATRAAAAAADEQSEQAEECGPKRRQPWYRCRQVQLTVLGYGSIALLSTFTNEVCAASEPAAPLHVDAGSLPSLQPFMAVVVHGDNLSQGQYSSLLGHLSLPAVAPHRHSHVLMFG